MMFIKYYAPNRCLCIKEAKLITGLRIAENGSYCENVKRREKKSGGRGGGCAQRMEVIVKRKKSQLWGGQGRCEQRSEAFVKIQKKIYIFFFLGGGGGGGVRVDVNGEVKLL